MKINKTILVLSDVCKNCNLATIVEMRDKITKNKELLTGTREVLVGDELFPTQYAVQIAEIDEQISYYDANLVVLEKALEKITTNSFTNNFCLN
jgi:hypothetical protein